MLRLFQDLVFMVVLCVLWTDSWQRPLAASPVARGFAVLEERLEPAFGRLR